MGGSRVRGRGSEGGVGVRGGGGVREGRLWGGGEVGGRVGGGADDERGGKRKRIGLYCIGSICDRI